MNAVARIGADARGRWRALCYLAAVIWAVLAVSLRRSTWRRTIRGELSRQIMGTGVEASRFVLYVSLALGISVVAQALVWMEKIGQTRLLGPLLVTVLVREAVPVLTNLLAIARNGTALTTELGRMQVSGEVRVLDAQGLDPFVFLVVPRVLGLTLAVFCLNVIFLFGALLSGYLFGIFLGPGIEGPTPFFRSILLAVSPLDLVNFFLKSLIPALLTGVICCTEGLGVGTNGSEVPVATRRALARSVRALFFSAALISLLTYL